MTKRYVIVVDGVESTRYNYNLWESNLLEDGTVELDARVAHGDQLQEFMQDVAKIIGRTSYNNIIEAKKDGWMLVPCAFPTRFNYYVRDGVQKREDELVPAASDAPDNPHDYCGEEFGCRE